MLWLKKKLSDWTMSSRLLLMNVTKSWNPSIWEEMCKISSVPLLTKSKLWCFLPPYLKIFVQFVKNLCKIHWKFMLTMRPNWPCMVCNNTTSNWMRKRRIENCLTCWIHWNSIKSLFSSSPLEEPTNWTNCCVLVTSHRLLCILVYHKKKESKDTDLLKNSIRESVFPLMFSVEVLILKELT